MIRTICALALALFTGCATSPSPPGPDVAQICEMAAYLTAKRTILDDPATREHFQSAADILLVLVSDWTDQTLVTTEDLRQALLWLPVTELRSSGGVILITDSDVLLDTGRGSSPILDTQVRPVALAVHSGLARFLAIRD